MFFNSTPHLPATLHVQPHFQRWHPICKKYILISNVFHIQHTKWHVAPSHTQAINEKGNLMKARISLLLCTLYTAASFFCALSASAQSYVNCGANADSLARRYTEVWFDSAELADQISKMRRGQGSAAFKRRFEYWFGTSSDSAAQRVQNTLAEIYFAYIVGSVDFLCWDNQSACLSNSTAMQVAASDTANGGLVYVCPHYFNIGQPYHAMAHEIAHFNGATHPPGATSRAAARRNACRSPALAVNNAYNIGYFLEGMPSSPIPCP